ncbi:MAG: TIGR02996 domain-containing protein [Kofleriaceae bacterium]
MVPGLSAARAGDWPACLAELLTAWRIHRTRPLADAIELAGKRAATKDIRPTSAAIRKKISTLTPADVTPLIETIQRQARVSPKMIGLAIELAQRSDPDPRIATLLRWFTSQDDLLPALVDALATHDDPRSRELLADRAKYWHERRGRFHQRRGKIDHLVAVAGQAWPTYAPFPGDLTELEPLLATRTEHDLTHLLDAVYTDLPNDTPRMIYADALQDAGDPRGEMITSQLTNPGTRRELQLIRDHERAWLGPLDKVVQKSGVVWHRGFLSSARLATRNIDDVTAADRMWFTVEELDLGEAWGEQAARWITSLPSLRRVYRFLGRDVRFLPSTLPWTHFGLRTGHVPSAFPSFPALEELDLSNFGHVTETQRFYTSLKSPPPRVRIAEPVWEINPFVPDNTVVVIVPEFEFPPLARQPEIWIRDREVDIYHVDKSLAYPLAVLPRIRDRVARITVHTSKSLDLQALSQIAPTELAP